MKRWIRCFAFAPALLSMQLSAVTYTWNVASGGTHSWNDANNWLPNTDFPRNLNDVAQFLNVNVAEQTISLTQDISVLTITFNSPNNYHVVGMNSITLADNSDVRVLNSNGNGAHSIAVPLIFSPDAGDGYAVFRNNSTQVFDLSEAPISASRNQIDILASSSASGGILFSDDNSFTNNTLGLGSFNIGNILPGRLVITSDGAFGNIVTPIDFVDQNVTGTLQNTAAVTSSRTIRFGTLGIYTLQTDAPLIWNGFITGFGGTPGFTKAGISSLTLGNNTNNFTGTVVISQGTLIISDNGNLGNAANGLTFSGAGILQTTTNTVTTTRTATLNAPATFQTDSALNWNGNITGASSLTKTGASTLTMGAGTKDYMGGTILNAGTVSIDAVAKLGSGAVSFTGNSTLAFSASIAAFNLGVSMASGVTGTINTAPATSSTITAAVTGDGALEKNGTGTLTLQSNSNNYQGGTTISAGTLTLTGTLDDDHPLNLTASGATFIFSGMTPAALAVSDWSGVTGTTVTAGAKNFLAGGTNSTSFDGTLTGTGTFTKQNSGILTLGIGGSITQTSAVVAGGSLSVIGSLTAATTVNAAGTLQGTGPITGNVINNGTVAPGTSIGILNIVGDYTQASGSTLEIELNPTQADLLSVTGTVTIEPGATLALFPEAGSYPLQSIYTIVTAGVTLTGQFDLFTNSNPSFNFQVFHLSNSVVLLLSPSFAQTFPSGTLHQVGSCVDTLQGADSLLNQLHILPLAALEDSLDQMHPALFNNLNINQEEVLVQLRNRLSQRMHLLSIQCFDDPYFHSWADGSYFYCNQGSEGGNTGYKSHAWAAMVGLDRNWDSACIGGALAYTRERLFWKQGRGSDRENNPYGMLYAGWYPSPGYFQMALIGCLNFCDGHRNIRIPGASFLTETFASQNLTANHDQMSGGLLSSFECGAMVRKENVEVRPFVRADYLFLRREAFQEKGAGALDLYVEAQNADLLRAEGGLQFAKCFRSFIPHCKFSGIVEERFLGEDSKSHFTDSSCVMELKGFSPFRFLFAVSAGLTGRVNDHFQIQFSGDGEWGDHYVNYAASFQLNGSF